MRLAAFIRGNIEPISVEWERFAATLLPEEELSSSVLRNSIAELLTEIAADMDEDLFEDGPPHEVYVLDAKAREPQVKRHSDLDEELLRRAAECTHLRRYTSRSEESPEFPSAPLLPTSGTTCGTPGSSAAPTCDPDLHSARW